MTDITIFSNRLRKNYRHYAKWAKRRGINCYRVYDRDVPEFPVAIDVYEQRAHLQEFDTGWQISFELNGINDQVLAVTAETTRFLPCCLA